MLGIVKKEEVKTIEKKESAANLTVKKESNANVTQKKDSEKKKRILGTAHYMAPEVI